MKLNRISSPSRFNESVLRRVWRIQTGNPDTVVQRVHHGPGVVPVTLHPDLSVGLLQFWVQEHSGKTTFISQSGAIASHVDFLFRLLNELESPGQHLVMVGSAEMKQIC